MCIRDRRYDLPIPLSFYVWGAGATVALSFVGFTLFLRQEPNLSCLRAEWHPKGRLVNAVVMSARSLAVGLLALVIVAGLFGSQDPIRNIAPAMIWIIAWVGLAFLSLFRRSVGVDQPLGHSFYICRELLPPHPCGCRAGFREALS